MQIQPTFGNTYRFYDKGEALGKKQELTQQGVDAAVEYRSSQGMLQVITYLVHTDEDGTQDLSDFRARGGREIMA